jgi:hypothetical protein
MKLIGMAIYFLSITEDSDVSQIDFWKNEGKELLIYAVWNYNCYTYSGLSHHPIFLKCPKLLEPKKFEMLFLTSTIFTFKLDKQFRAVFEI